MFLAACVCLQRQGRLISHLISPSVLGHQTIVGAGARVAYVIGLRAPQLLGRSERFAHTLPVGEQRMVWWEGLGACCFCHQLSGWTLPTWLQANWVAKGDVWVCGRAARGWCASAQGVLQWGERVRVIYGVC